MKLHLLLKRILNKLLFVPFLFALIFSTLSCSDSNDIENMDQEFVQGVFGNDDVNFVLDQNMRLILNGSSNHQNVNYIYCNEEYIGYGIEEEFEFYLSFVIVSDGETITGSSDYKLYFFATSDSDFATIRNLEREGCSIYGTTGVVLTILDKVSGKEYSTLHGTQEEDSYFFSEYRNGDLSADFNCYLHSSLDPTEKRLFKGNLSLWIDYQR